MVRQRPQLGSPFGVDGPWLAAIMDVLGDIHDLLDERLPAADKTSPEPVSEPAPDWVPAVVPVREPAPDAPPPAAEPVSEPAPDDEPEVEEEEQRSLPPAPPRAGRGSGLDAWQTFADAAEVDYRDDATRADIIAACEAAGVIPAER